MVPTSYHKAHKMKFSKKFSNMDEQTINTYNELAKEYDRETTDFWDRFPRTIFDKFIEFTKGKILDVGSGPGRDGLILQKAGLDVICLDASEAMVKISTE